VEEDVEQSKVSINSALVEDHLLVNLFVKRVELQFGEGKSQTMLD
jgi:hypothetical protein